MNFDAALSNYQQRNRTLSSASTSSNQDFQDSYGTKNMQSTPIIQFQSHRDELLEKIKSIGNNREKIETEFSDSSQNFHSYSRNLKGSSVYNVVSFVDEESINFKKNKNVFEKIPKPAERKINRLSINKRKMSHFNGNKVKPINYSVFEINSNSYPTSVNNNNSNECKHFLNESDVKFFHFDKEIQELNFDCRLNLNYILAC